MHNRGTIDLRMIFLLSLLTILFDARSKTLPEFEEGIEEYDKNDAEQHSVAAISPSYSPSPSVEMERVIQEAEGKNIVQEDGFMFNPF